MLLYGYLTVLGTRKDGEAWESKKEGGQDFLPAFGYARVTAAELLYFSSRVTWKFAATFQKLTLTAIAAVHWPWGC